MSNQNLLDAINIAELLDISFVRITRNTPVRITQVTPILTK